MKTFSSFRIELNELDLSKGRLSSNVERASATSADVVPDETLKHNKVTSIKQIGDYNKKILSKSTPPEQKVKLPDYTTPKIRTKLTQPEKNLLKINFIRKRSIEKQKAANQWKNAPSWDDVHGSN